MADDTSERVEKQEIGKSPKTVRCRFHETEEYQMFCKDCKDFVCFECLGRLHQKHNLCRLKDAEEDIRTEMEVLVFEGKYAKQLNSLSDQLSENKKKLVMDEERLKYEIRASVEHLKQKIDLSEENLLSELRNTFKSNHTTLQDQEIHVNNLQTIIDNFDVNNLHECSLSHIMNILSEMKLCSSKSDEITYQPITGFTPIMEFSIGNLIKASSGKRDADTISLSPCSDIATQTDFLEDSETEWFDAEDYEEDDLIERSSDEVTDIYPMHFQLKQDITLVKKIVPISEKDAWILANGKLLKIVNRSLDDIVYADNVSDFVVLKDACVLILSEENSFIMKLLTDRRQVRFANIGRPGRKPHCFCISEDDLLVVYLVSFFEYSRIEYIHYFIWMNTDGIITDQASFYKDTFKRPCSIQILESYLCVLYCKGNASDLHRIELLEKKSDKYNSIKSFNGIYGLDASSHFQSQGMCVGKAGNVIISDFRHHSVYLVDKDLKYKKTLLDAKNGFDKPAAIGILNDHMWISDGNQIFIFNLAYT